MRDFLIVFTIFMVGVGLLGGISEAINRRSEEIKKVTCVNLATEIQYPTVYFEGAGCLVELREGWWIPENDVIKYIYFLDCGEKLK